MGWIRGNPEQSKCGKRRGVGEPNAVRWQQPMGKGGVAQDLRVKALKNGQLDSGPGLPRGVGRQGYLGMALNGQCRGQSNLP